MKRFHSSSSATTTVLLGGLTLGQVKRGVVQAGDARLLDRRALCAKRLHDARRARRHQILVRRAPAAPHRGLLPGRITRASSRLLKHVGFKREGYARAYLRINGAWEDHLLYALLETDRTPPPPPGGRPSDHSS